jgi:DNA polymerase III subunit delta
MLHVYYGPDSFRSQEALTELRTSLDCDGMLSSNTSVLAGRGLKPAELTQHAMAAPFLAESRLVIVEGLLTALGSRRGVADEWQPFIEAQAQLPPSNHVVLLEPAPKRDVRDSPLGRSPLLKALKSTPDVEVREFAELKTYSRDGTSEVGRWLYDRAQSRGIAINTAAIDPLVDLMGADLRALANELEKLAAHASAVGSPAVEVEHVRTLTPQAREESMFAVVDAIVEGRGDLALRLLRRMLDDGSVAPILVQIMVGRQLRHLVRATELLERHASQQEIADATGLRGFPLTKLMRQARQVTRPVVEANLRDLEATDFSVKTGKQGDELALELLVCRLAERAPRAARRPPQRAAR